MFSHKCALLCILPALPTKSRPAVAELKPAPTCPGVAAGPGAGTGSYPPGEHASDRDHRTTPPGSSCADKLTAQRGAGDGHASQPLYLLPADAPAVPVSGEQHIEQRGVRRKGKSAMHPLCFVQTLYLCSAGRTAWGVWYRGTQAVPWTHGYRLASLV